jgi:hypothetical protein
MQNPKYDPKLWGPYIAVGLNPEPKLPDGAKCDNHPARFAFNLLVATTGSEGQSGADVYLCRECFLDQRPSPKRHDYRDRRPKS